MGNPHSIVYYSCEHVHSQCRCPSPNKTKEMLSYPCDDCKNKGSLTLRQLQDYQKAWTAHNFPDAEPYHPLLGMNEELGELNHAHLKGIQGIRHTPEEIQAMKIDAVGDIVIYLADYCTRNGIDLQDAVEKTWSMVQQRDWQANSRDGSTTAP